VHVLQLDPTDVVLLPSPLLRALKTDISRRSLEEPHFGHFRPLPLLPARHSRSSTLSHFSQRNS
jgi:hypothetical protein